MEFGSEITSISERHGDGGNPLSLGALIVVHIAVCCASLVLVAHSHSTAFIFFEKSHLLYAILVTAAFSLVSLAFVFARFSFGYFVGFYFYSMIVGFLWLSSFSNFNYNLLGAEISAAASAIAFLIPTLVSSPLVQQRYRMSDRVLETVLKSILAMTVLTLILAAIYNFRIIGLDKIYEFRDRIQFPPAVRYLIGITSSALLPFAFACFFETKDRWRAGITLLLILCFYPITLTKTAFFTPIWLIAMLILSRVFSSRVAVVSSLLLPLLAGMILAVILKGQGNYYFETVNFRMMTVPSSAMDIYNDFFSKHELTHFCQISFLKSFIHCPYQEQLGPVMEKAYGLGSFNASLFATEGVASVGMKLAPLSALVCGLLVALGNCASKGLPPRFIMISGGLLPHIFLNVPLTTTLLTHGAAILFLLWYVMPRTPFQEMGYDQKRKSSAENSQT